MDFEQKMLEFETFCMNELFSISPLLNLGLENDRTKFTIDDLSDIQVDQKSGKRYKCEYCEKSFLHVSKFLVHKRVHIDSQNYICEQCGKAYKYLRSLKKHLRSHQGPLVIKCKWCPAKFNDKKTLRLHEQNHTFFKCEKCDKTFVWESAFSKHICPFKIYNNMKFCSARRKHNKTVKRVWLCPFCSKYFTNVKDVYDHTLYNHMIQ